MTNDTASLARLDAIADPTDDDLYAVEDIDATVDTDDTLTVDIDDDWSWDDEDDYSPRDDRWDGDGVPSWSAWA